MQFGDGGIEYAQAPMQFRWSLVFCRRGEYSTPSELVRHMPASLFEPAGCSCGYSGLSPSGYWYSCRWWRLRGNTETVTALAPSAALGEDMDGTGKAYGEAFVVG
jgi:hypothetical protein